MRLMMKFIDWLTRREKKLLTTEIVEVPLVADAEEPKPESKLMQVMKEIEEKRVELPPIIVEDTKKHTDPETGKVYKTESALKAAITRRQNRKNRESKK